MRWYVLVLILIGFCSKTSSLVVSNALFAKAHHKSIYRLPSSTSINKNLYTSDIQSEKESQFAEIIITPPRIKEVNLNRLVFTDDLSREFRTQYRERFQTQWQQTEITLQEMFTAYNRRVVEESQRRREFAEYILKRLTEHHVDQYIQSDPAMRTVYEVKEKLQKVEVRVNKETKLDLRYSLAGNIFDFIFVNPYFEEAKITYRMDPRSFGPTSPLVTEYRLTKAVTNKRKVQMLYEEQITTLSVFMLHNLNPQLNTFYGFSASPNAGDAITIDPLTNQPIVRMLDPIRIQAGFGWTF